MITMERSKSKGIITSENMITKLGVEMFLRRYAVMNGADIDPKMKRVVQEINFRRTPVVMIFEMIVGDDSLAIWR